MAASERLYVRLLAILLLWDCCSLLIGQASSQSIFRQNVTWPKRLLPGMESFPESQRFTDLMKTMKGGWVFGHEPLYVQAIKVYNMRLLSTPGGIAYVETVEDVQKVIRFAKQWNLFVCVRSSGHSFIGRSTHDGSIIIDLRKMKGKEFKLNSNRAPAGEVTVESGNNWLEVYRAVDKQVTMDGAGGQARRRVIVGGSAHTVAMGGYTLGGGQSPIGRKLGLAVDNLLEATIVLADGRKAVVNSQGMTLTSLDSNRTEHSADTSLFWALRGGGGSAWGVVTHFTFRLHFAPQRFRRVSLNWALNWKGWPVGTDTVKHVLKQVGRLSEDWGGYLIVSGSPLDADTVGSLSLFLNHFGNDSSPSNAEIDNLLRYNPHTTQYMKNDTRFNTFLDYEETVYDPPETYSYIYNTFIQNHSLFDDQKLEHLTEFLMDLKNAPTNTSGHVCTGTLIGGQMARQQDGTPVNPKFRSGLFSMSCALGWADPVHQDDFYIKKSLEMRNKLSAMGEGSYFNEPAEDLDDWKQQFWGSESTYQRLLDIKKRWDPDNFFWCHNCVGSDLKKEDIPATTTTTTTIPATTTTTTTTTQARNCPTSGAAAGKALAGLVGYLMLAALQWVLAFKWG